MHLKDSRVRILVSNSVTLNQYLQLSENFFVPRLRKGIIFLLISQGMVVRIQLDSDLESTPKVIESVQIMGFCYCSVFITGETKMKLYFLLSVHALVEKTDIKVSIISAFFVHVPASFFPPRAVFIQVCEKRNVLISRDPFS